jgi:DNA invertase Pin-like site-specific DNA recombinase
MARTIRMVGYVRVSSTSPSKPQARVIEDVARARGWRLLEWVSDGPDAGPKLDRRGLHRALGLLETGEAQVLVVSSLDRLALTLRDLALLFDWFEQAGADLLAAGGTLPIDTTTEQGAQMTSGLAALGEWERGALAQRTQEALEASRARGRRISRQAVADIPDLRELIERLRKEGLTLQEIADVLNQHGVPTLRGGARWRPSSLQAALGYRRRRPRQPSPLPPSHPSH